MRSWQGCSACTAGSNGASELIRSDHCNTAVVRWSLREHGVILAGPAPKSLVDPVSAAQLRADVRAATKEWADFASAPTKAGPMSRWLQPLLVLSYCRMLHTLESGRVTSKREAGEWALGAIHPRWATLICSALDQRADPWLRVYQPADPAVVGRTLAFIAYSMHESAVRYGDGGGSHA